MAKRFHQNKDDISRAVYITWDSKDISSVDILIKWAYVSSKKKQYLHRENSTYSRGYCSSEPHQPNFFNIFQKF